MSPISGRHVREHRSLRAAAQKRALNWIAARLPERIHSDHLSGLEVASMLAVGALRAVRAPRFSLALFRPMRLFDLGGTIGAVGLLAVFLASAVRNTRAVYAVEPTPSRRGAPRVA